MVYKVLNTDKMQDYSTKFQNQHRKNTFSPNLTQTFTKPISILPSDIQSHQNIRNTIAYSININPVYQPQPNNQLQPIPYNPSTNIRADQLTDQFIHSLLNTDDLDNTMTIKSFKGLDYQGRQKLQKYCIKQFTNQPLFILYQISLELGLEKLRKICTDQLINQNYQQLNYYKPDLVKCSYSIFKRILDQYKNFIINLEIKGLKLSDLKSVIDDYCTNWSIDQKDKNNLYNQFIYVKENNFLLTNQKQTEVRRSMIETRNNNIEAEELPAKVKNTMNLPRIAKLTHVDFDGDQIIEGNTSEDLSPNVSPNSTKLSTELDKKDMTHSSTNLNRSQYLIRTQIEQLQQKQSQLYTQISQTLKQVSTNNNENHIKQQIIKLENQFKNMENIIQTQAEKINKLQKSVNGIKDNQKQTNKVDFVFNF